MIDKPILIPLPLADGDKIAIVSPAGIARAEDVYGAVCVLERQGWEPVVMPHALGRRGSFSGTAEERFEDLCSAFANPEIRAVVCSRGGYGAVHLLNSLDELPLRNDPKWLIGFSDITALHGSMLRHGIASIHGPMAKYVRACDGKNPDFEALCQILRGEKTKYHFEAHPLNREGRAEGVFVGGNLAVMGGLVGTPYDMFCPGTVLLIEDIAEPIYKVERQLWQLRLKGVLKNLKGLLVGAFTDYRPTADYQSMEEMISAMTADCDYPVVFGVPCGHGGRSLPMIEGARIKINVHADEGADVEFLY